jgi:hypothetical protein
VEGGEQFMVVQEEEDIVSTRSFELRVQWLYTGRVIFEELPPEEAITDTIEFTRLADMCGVTDMEYLMAERIKALLVGKPALTKARRKKPDSSSHYLTQDPGGIPARKRGSQYRRARHE